MWVAAAAFVGGSFLIVYRGFVWIAVTYELVLEEVSPATITQFRGALSRADDVGDGLRGLVSSGRLWVRLKGRWFNSTQAHHEEAPSRRGVFATADTALRGSPTGRS